MDCIFCKLVSGEIPKRSLYEDDVCEVVMDAFPATEGHVLIILKDHVECLEEASYEIVSHVAKVSKFISTAMRLALKPDGITTVENSGLLQEVPHAHIHIIPTYKRQQGLEFRSEGDSSRIEIEYQKILSRIQ